MPSRVYCKFSIEGFHSWPDADKHSSEAYLKDRHRHMFYFKCTVGVDADDREIEFISMRRAIKAFLINNWNIPCEFKNMSCEMIAKAVLKFIQAKYGVRYYEVDVSEDDENGAVILDD